MADIAYNKWKRLKKCIFDKQLVGGTAYVYVYKFHWTKPRDVLRIISKTEPWFKLIYVQISWGKSSEDNVPQRIFPKKFVGYICHLEIVASNLLKHKFYF